MDFYVVASIAAILLVVGVAYRFDQLQAKRKRQRKEDEAMAQQNEYLRQIAEQQGRQDSNA